MQGIDLNRIAPLDGVRGVAILMVLVWHYIASQVVAEPGSLGRALLAPLQLGLSGVDLFFVLSGFLIAGILIDNRDAQNFFRVFYVRRVCRIFPVYFLLLAFFVAFAAADFSREPAFSWLMADPLPLWTYATFTQNIAMGYRGDLGPHFLGITWSLAVEEQFYLVIPVLIFFLPRRVALAVLVVAILMAPALRYVSQGLHAHINTPWRSDSLLTGVVLAYLVRWQPFASAVQNHPEVPRAAFALLLAGAAVMVLRPGVFGVFTSLWLGLLYALLILLAYSFGGNLLAKALSLNWLVWLGQRSYAVYMFHEATSGLLHGFIHRRAPRIADAGDAVVTLLALAVTLLLAELSMRFIEGPVIRYGHRTLYSPGPGQQHVLHPRG